MTTVTMHDGPNKTEIQIVGHADYAPEGKDIVCSAVSVLSYALGQTLLNEASNGNLEIQQLSFESGNVCFSVVYKDPMKEKVDLIFSTIMNGYLLLANTYPAHVLVQ